MATHHYYKAQLQVSGLSGSLRRQLFLLRCVKEKVTHVCGLYVESKVHSWSLILSSIKSLHRKAALTKVEEKRSSSRTRGRRCSRGKAQGSRVRGLCSLYFSWLSSTIPGQCSEMCPSHVSCMSHIWKVNQDLSTFPGKWSMDWATRLALF